MELQKLQLPEEKFIAIFQGIHNLPADRARNMFQVEAHNFMKILTDKPELQDCTDLSIRSVFLDVITNGLSFGATAKHVYLQNDSCKSGRKDQTGRDIYEDRLTFSPAPDGKIYMCQRAGSLDRIQGPVIVYEGDTYSTGTDRHGNTWVEHQPGTRTTGKIIAGFCWQVFTNGTKNAVTMDMAEITRRMGYSAKRNRRTGQANALYTSYNGQIDPGFFGAKIIDAATKGLRKKEINSQYITPNEEAGDEIYDEPEQNTNTTYF